MATTPTRASSADSARNRIADEHHRLSALLQDLTTTRDVVRFDRILGELQALLEEHFDGEESSSGLHEAIGEDASDCLTEIQRLVDEHAVILELLRRLRADSADLLKGPAARLLHDAQHLANVLKRHEQEEDELFGQAYYRDLGRS
jgi:hemerythrin